MLEQVAILILRALAWLALVASLVLAVLIATSFTGLPGLIATDYVRLAAVLLAFAAVLQGAFVWAILYVIAGVAEKVIDN